MRDIGLADSARFLARNGHETTPASLYLAHATSRETALRLLQADPDSLAVNVDPESASARLDLFQVDGDEEKPRTVGEVIAFAEQAMADTRPVDVREQLGGVSDDFLKALKLDADESNARAAEAKLAEHEAYRARIAETEAAIDAGTFGHADLVKAAGEGGWIRAEDFPRLFNRLVGRSATALEYEKAVSKFLDPEHQFDPTSPDDQRTVDLLYERSRTIVGDGPVDGSAEAHGFLDRVVARTGITPTAATVEAANADATATNPSEGLRAEAGDSVQLPVDDAVHRGDGDVSERIQLAQVGDGRNRPPRFPRGGGVAAGILTALEILAEFFGRKQPSDDSAGQGDPGGTEATAQGGTESEQPEPSQADDPNFAPSSHPLKQRYAAHEISKERVPFDEMAKNANRISRNRLTDTGRGLQKHANRPFSVYPKPQAENFEEYNRLAAELVDKILHDPDNIVVRTRDGKIDVWDGTGKLGIRFNRGGTFHSFREPSDKGN